MSSALEQSLDAIISKDRASNPRKKLAQKKQQLAKKKQAAAAAAAGASKAKAGVKKNAAAAAVASTVLDTTKVMVSGLPRDIDFRSIKEFFNSQVGGCQNVVLAYNSQGKSTGNATVTFKSAVSAKNAVAKFQGAPIDGGKSKLTLMLVVDPTKKPLAARIVANKPLKAKVAAVAAQKKKVQAKKVATKAGKNVRAKVRPAKKTLEQLDAEMAEYFSKNE